MTNALTIPVMSSSLESYIHSANSFPLLSQEEENELAKRLRDHGDISAAQQLILSHLRFVISIARSYKGYGSAPGGSDSRRQCGFDESSETL